METLPEIESYSAAILRSAPNMGGWVEITASVQDDFKRVNREYKKELKALYMQATCLLMGIAKPVEEWKKMPDNRGRGNDVRELFMKKAVEISENIKEEMHLAEENDYPEDTVTHAVQLHGMLRMFRDSCRDNGVPRLKRRRDMVRRGEQFLCGVVPCGRHMAPSRII